MQRVDLWQVYMQTDATCWAQQCYVLLANNVASVCMGLKVPNFEIEKLLFNLFVIFCSHLLQAPTERLYHDCTLREPWSSHSSFSAWYCFLYAKMTVFETAVNHNH